MSDTTSSVILYNKYKEIKIKSGLIFKRQRDPSEDLEAEIRQFLQERRTQMNDIVARTFDLPEGGYTKFEFVWTPQRARVVHNKADNIEKRNVLFRSNADVTLLYLKEKSLVLFSTEYRFAITEPGCGGNSPIWYTGGKNYTLEEIYFNKISTVGAYHDEELYRVYTPGCGGGAETNFTIEKDGFVIRAGEAFRIIASKRFANELRDARQMINSKISENN